MMGLEELTYSDQYLTFSIGGDEYAIDILLAREVLEEVPLTRVPRMPSFMSGLINLRGTVLPVIDLAAKIGVGRAVMGAETCILVVDAEIDGEPTLVGMMMDGVRDVVRFDPSSLAPPPRFGSGIRKKFIRAVARREDRFVIVLDVAQLLSEEELADIWKSWESRGDIEESDVSWNDDGPLRPVIPSPLI